MPLSAPDPVVALAAFVALAALLLAAFWPRTGVVARVLRATRLSDRVLTEDALKHLLRCEMDGTPASVESLAGALGITRAAAARMLERLENNDLVRADGTGFPLTDAGRAYGTRILRTHRLWERYLADRTGVRPELWHEEAEAREHTLSAADTETLAASLGHPMYDPHGDPIPTAGGALPPMRGVPLPTLAPGETGVVSHLEDEPPEVFERIVAERLALRMRVEVLASPPGEVRFRTERGVHSLPPVVANNITVERASELAPRATEARTLADVASGQEARVVAIANSYAGAPRRRLLDLGIVPGTVVRAEFRGAAGGPMAYRVRGALIALRAEQASQIEVEHAEAAGTEGPDDATPATREAAS